MFQATVTLVAPSLKIADRAYYRACIYPSGRKNDFNLRTGQVTMKVDWVMESPTTKEETLEALTDCLVVERCEELGVDIEGIEVSEVD